MRPVLKRIAANGLLTALFLSIIGYGFAELASFWLAGAPGVRPGAIQPTDPHSDDAMRDALRYRLPLAMAGWGFLFVAVGEVGLSLWRGKRSAPTAPAGPKPDPAEELLEQLLQQAEAAQANRPEATASSSARAVETA